ncbi:EF-hand domain-containing protein [Sphingomonas psychrotolerans]|uniref:EF-hand domain-containing protein n=1 Tax=Sphingomonas psychrotolerans TaxID=1327635 RepID=A0ABU3N3Z0_9SPHN|nr:EF-hand domain-containing protein [Sphingomonas psychrotolerans]MDT8759254.1 EF-hand domain-containing protein [Sphingomonas psychrotolerans]
MRLFLLLAAFAAAPALAQQVPVTPVVPGPQAQPAATVMAEPVALMIAAFDSDGDARVSRAEFETGLRRSFESIDTGKTGALGYIAFSDWSERWLGDRNTLPSPFETDRDGDNRISWDELAARFDLLFARFDTNKDNVLVRSELLTLRPQLFDRDRRGREMGKPGKKPRN